MNIQEIKQLIANGEKIDGEYKESKNALLRMYMIQYALLIIGTEGIYYLR